MGMKRLVLMGVAALLASPAHAHNCRALRDDAAQIERSINAFYVALAKDDQAAFERSVTGNFEAFELGKRLSGGDLFKLVGDAHRAGRVINWTIERVAVRVDCATALATWDNRGSAGVPPKIAPRNWLESALLRRSPTGWRLAFFHSTVVPEAR